MPPLQRACLLLLLALLGLCLSLGQAKDVISPSKHPDLSNVTTPTSSSLRPPGASPPLLSMALGVVAALLLLR